MRSPVFFPVPAGLERSECDACPKHVYWIRTAKGKRMPVDVDVDGGIAPTATEPGRGFAHFATCPQAQRFRRAPAPVRKRALRMAAHRSTGATTLTLVRDGSASPAVPELPHAPPAPPAAPQPSLFESTPELLQAVGVVAKHSGVGEGRILSFKEDARSAARSALGRTFGESEHNQVREAVSSLERFHGERW